MIIIKRFTRIISLIMTVAMLFSICSINASAVTPPSSGTADTIWSWLTQGSVSMVEYVNTYFKKDSGCAVSPNGLHHWQGDTTIGFITDRVWATCTHCHMKYTDYLNTAYTDYVKGLPAYTVGNDGYLYVCPKYSDCTTLNFGYCEKSSGSYNYRINAVDTPLPYVNKTSYFEMSASLLSDYSYNLSLIYCSSLYSLTVLPYFKAPIAGSYSVPESVVGSYRVVNKDGTVLSGSTLSSRSINPNTTEHRALGESMGRDFFPCVFNPVLPSGSFSIVSATVYMPVWRVLPDSGLVSVKDGTYSGDARVGSLSGNFGYTGNDGTMITAENIKIVNETTNTVFNPVTKTTTNFKDWTYDYSTRTYNFTLDTGTKQTVTYGDENVTIKEGDTIYNIYYVTPDGGTPPVTCKHDYIPAVTTAATCIAPGVKTYTCSKCKDSYIEKIPAIGHSWIVKETVKTTYDTTGAPLTQGYTIWKCSVCGEEYKDSSGAGPPGGGSSGGDVITKEGFLSKLWGILLSFAEGLSSLFKFLFGAEGQSNLDFFNKPSTFSGVDIWA